MGKKKLELVNKVKTFYTKQEDLQENYFVNKRIVSLAINNINANLELNQKLDLLANKENALSDFTKKFMDVALEEIGPNDLTDEVANSVKSIQLTNEGCQSVINILKNNLDEDVFNGLFENTYNEAIFNSYDLNKDLNNEATVNFINECETILDDDIDKIIPESKYYDKPINTIGLDKEYYKKEIIDELKEDNPNQTELLEEASKITTEYGDYVANIYLGQKNQRNFANRTNEEVKLINNDLKDEEKQFVYKGGFINISETTNDNKKEIVNGLFNKEITLADTDKENIKNIYNKIVSLNDNKLLQNLSLRKFDVRKAIDTKNIEEIDKAVKNYKAVEKQYLDLFKEIDKLGNPNFTPSQKPLGNHEGSSINFINSQRSQAIFRSLFNLHKELSDTNVTIDDILNNPTKAIKDYLAEKQENNPINKMLKEKSVYDTVDALFQNNTEMNDAQKEYSQNGFNFYMGLDAVNCLLSEGNLDFGAYTKASMSSIYSDVMPNTDKLFFTDFVKTQEIIKNLLVQEDAHRDLMLVQLDEKFDMTTLDYSTPYLDSKGFIKSNGTCEDIIIRLMENAEKVNAYTSKYEEKEEYEPRLKYDQNILLSRAIKDAAKEILEIAPLDKDAKRICNALKDGKLNTISKQDKEHFIKSAEVKLAKKNNTIKADLGKHMKTLVDMEEDYNKRSTFWKIFGRETHRLKRAINSIKTDLKEQLPNQEAFDKLYNDIKENNVNSNSVDGYNIDTLNASNNLEDTKEVVDLNKEFDELSNDSNQSLISDNNQKVNETDISMEKE